MPDFPRSSSLRCNFQLFLTNISGFGIGSTTIGDTSFFRYARYTHFLGASALLQRGHHTITAGWMGV